MEERFRIEVTERLELDWDVRINERTELQTYIRSIDDRYKFVLFREGDAWVDGQVDDFVWAHPVQLRTKVNNPRWYRLVDNVLQQHDPPDLPLRAVGRAVMDGVHVFQIEGDEVDPWWIPREDVTISIQE